MSKFKDFDKFFEEKEEDIKPAIEISLFGKTYQLPSSIPATIVLKNYVALKEGRENYTAEDELILMVETVGEENLREWSELGLTRDQLKEIFYWVITGCQDDEEEDSTSVK